MTTPPQLPWIDMLDVDETCHAIGQDHITATVRDLAGQPTLYLRVPSVGVAMMFASVFTAQLAWNVTRTGGSVAEGTDHAEEIMAHASSTWEVVYSGDDPWLLVWFPGVEVRSDENARRAAAKARIALEEGDALRPVRALLGVDTPAAEQLGLALPAVPKQAP
jgi:hypothetical protein